MRPWGVVVSLPFLATMSYLAFAAWQTTAAIKSYAQLG
jgi:hypothetical protein